jgi:CBS domain-containing protein
MQTDLPVKEIMTREVCTSGKSESLLNASRKMIRFGVGSVVVVEDHRPVGIVTEKDILVKVVAKNKVPSEVMLEDIMTHPILTIKPTTSLREAADLMQRRGIRRLPVVDGSNLIGIVTDTDILSVSFDLGELMGLLKEKSFGYEEIVSGKCERCGKFSEHLNDINGLRLCEDCIESFVE